MNGHASERAKLNTRKHFQFEQKAEQQKNQILKHQAAASHSPFFLALVPRLHCSVAFVMSFLAAVTGLNRYYLISQIQCERARKAKH